MSTISLNKTKKTETEVAILQLKVETIEEKISDLKVDIKEVRDSMDKNSENQIKMIKEMQTTSENAHHSLSNKISSLEKWRWMMMGAGVVIGSLGYDTLAKLLK